MLISVVIAAYNEAENIGPLTERLVDTLDAMPGVRWELIYVIEGEDETISIARRLAAERREIRILYQAQPSGLGNAFRKGFDAVSADADLVITMDADLNHQPEEIPRLVAKLEERHADIVIGSRKVAGSLTEGAPLWKRLLSDAVNRGMRWLMRMPVADQTSGYRVYRAAALSSISWDSTGFAFLPEILMRAHGLGYRMVEEPIQFVFRTAGESKMRIFATASSYLSLLRRRRKFARRPNSNTSAQRGGRTAWDRHWISRGGVEKGSAFGWISRLVRRIVFQPAVAHFLEQYFPAEGVFVELGCGTGESSARVPRRQRRFVGLDFSWPALNAARRSDCYHTHLCADISNLPFRSMSVDGVWNLGVMEHFPPGPLRASLREFERVLKPGGTAVLFWPGERNSSRWLLAPIEWAMSKLKRRPFHFFPDEVSRLKSRREAEEILRETGLETLRVDYSVRTWFIHTVVVAKKQHSIAVQCAASD